MSRKGLSGPLTIAAKRVEPRMALGADFMMIDPVKFSQRATRLQRSAVREFVKLTARPGMISFAGGLPAPELFPLEAIQQAAARVFSQIGRRTLQYGETEGVLELRQWLAKSFSTESFKVRSENVLITSGAQQALHLIGLVLIDEDDVVLTEDPTYLALLAAWRSLGARFVGVLPDAQGICIDALAHATSTQPQPGAPKLLYLQPNYQNPQGTTMASGRRSAVMELVRSRGLFVIEDNAYGELRYEGDALPHLLYLANEAPGSGPDEGRVAHVGTFSKIIAPGLRLGWVIGPAVLIDKLTQAKQAADLHTSTLNQYLALELLADGFLERHLPMLRTAYRTRRDTMLQALAHHFPADLVRTRPQGGLFLMLTLAGRRNARDYLQRALAEGVAFVPGDEFHLDGGGSNTMRLNFSNPPPNEIEEGIAKLRRAVSP